MKEIIDLIWGASAEEIITWTAMVGGFIWLMFFDKDEG